MQLTGVIAALIDVPQEHTEAYNRWYDFDHLPEFAALPEITAGRRYVATSACKQVRPASGLAELADGRGTYFTTYLLNTADLDQAMDSFGARGSLIREQRRMFRVGHMAAVEFYQLEHLAARRDIPVSPEAIPYLGHQGVLIALTQVADPDRRAAVNQWFADTHAPDVLEVPGVAAALRFSRHTDIDEGRFLNMYLLDGDPVEVAQVVSERHEQWRAAGRLFDPEDASRILFLSPYLAVAPPHYDFDIG
jgi:hypothetical protein